MDTVGYFCILVKNVLSFSNPKKAVSKYAFIFKKFHSILSFYSKNNNTSYYSIEKGIFAEIYYLFASERLLVYLLPILLQIFDFGNISIIGKSWFMQYLLPWKYYLVSMVYTILSNWHLFSTNGAFTSGTKKKVAVCHLSTSATASSSCKVRVIYEALFCHTARAAL